MLVLKPLDQAIRDNDSIRAVIVNTGLNQDGKTPGITMPSGAAQGEAWIPPGFLMPSRWTNIFFQRNSSSRCTGTPALIQPIVASLRPMEPARGWETQLRPQRSGMSWARRGRHGTPCGLVP
jgi:hypothetical protein